MNVSWTVFAGLLGLLVGPLLGIATDRLVDRVPPKFELRCAHCQSGLGRASLVPVFHWRLRCLRCAHLSAQRYVVVDLLACSVFALLAARFGISIKLVPYLLLGAALVVLSVVDAETRLLPNVVVWPSILVAFASTLLLSQVLDESRFMPALVGGLLFGGFVGASHIAYPRGMGRGDVKLALLLGFYVGWISTSSLDAVRLVLYALVLALLGGAIIGTLYNVVRKRGRAEVPFGPALAAGSLAIIVASPVILGAGVG